MKTFLAIIVTSTFLLGCSLGPVKLGSDSSYKYPNNTYSSPNSGYGSVYPNSGSNNSISTRNTRENYSRDK